MNRAALLAAGFGAALMTLAVVAVNVTLAGGDYRALLSIAIVLTVAAIGCLAFAFLNGGPAIRVASIVLALPVFDVVMEVLGRGEYVFL